MEKESERARTCEVSWSLCYSHERGDCGQGWVLGKLGLTLITKQIKTYFKKNEIAYMMKQYDFRCGNRCKQNSDVFSQGDRVNFTNVCLT